MNNNLKKLIELGKEAYEAEEHDKALDYLLAALDIKNDLADVHNLIGIIYHQQGRLDSAKKHFEKALDINPKYTDAALNLAVTYNEIGEYDKAREVVNNTLQKTGVSSSGLEPFALGKLANMHAELAEAYRGFGLLDEATKEYEKAVKLAPNFTDLRTKLAEVYRETGQYNKAEEVLLDILKTKPQSIHALTALGLVYYSKKEWEKAKEQWEKVLSLDQNNKQVKLYITMVQRKIS